MRRAAAGLAALLAAASAHGERVPGDAGPLFGNLFIVDEVRCGDPRDPHPFRESARGASRIARVLDRPCRVVEPDRDPRWCAYRVGAGSGLEARGAYLLEVEFPDDARRTTIVVNRGADTARGWRTGAQVPLTRGWLTQRTLFFLNDRTADLTPAPNGATRPLGPADGFWVVLQAPRAADERGSAGPAVSRIRLFAVPDVAALAPEIRYPPAPLPRRVRFIREGMAEAIAEESSQPALGSMDAFYDFRAQRLRAFGGNAFCQDLLVANRNTGWDAGDDEWYAPAPDPLRWDKIVQMVGRYGLALLPAFEYGGGGALGRARLDPADPRTGEDVRRLLEATIGRHRDAGAVFAGAWFRSPAAAWPEGPAEARTSFLGALRAVLSDQAGAGARLLVSPLDDAVGIRTDPVRVAGGVTADIERAGPACLLEDAAAVADRDPVWLGTEVATAWAPGFPEAVRAFNAAWLTLPALPSVRRDDLAPDRDVVVRVIDTAGQGTWVAVVNTGLKARPEVRIGLPADGRVTDLVSGGVLDSMKFSRSPSGTGLVVSLGPCELKTLRIGGPDAE